MTERLLFYAKHITTTGTHMVSEAGTMSDYIGGYFVLPGAFATLFGSLTGVMAFFLDYLPEYLDGHDYDNTGSSMYHNTFKNEKWRMTIMVRKLQKTDIDRVAYIWLDTNLKAHYFISAQYWKDNFELVKEMLLQAEVYVYERDQKIQGFIGLNDEYIEGIFVSDEMQSHGIGKILLDYVKGLRKKLLLNVYQKNTRAISFYQREGFEIQCNGLDEATGEKEYVMAWQQK